MIGIFGGTFDPIHYGHLRTALEVQQALGMSEMRFIPARNPPHREAPGAKAAQRLAMVEMATAQQPGFRVDARELQRSGPSYTLDTLRELRSELGSTPLCLLMGSDAFSGFPQWHEPENILQLTHLVVMRRPGEAPPKIYIDRRTDDISRLFGTQAGCILFQPVSQLEISATNIRQLIRGGRSARYLLPDPVLDMIQRDGLYGPE